MLYVDVLFVLNFVADWVLLYVTARARRIAVHKLRFSFSAALGSFYVVVPLLLPNTAWMGLAVCKLLMALLLIIVAFGFANWSSFMRNVLMFYAVSFLFAGFLFGAHQLIIGSSISEVDARQTAPVPWWLIILGFLVGLLLTGRVLQSLRQIRHRHAYTAAVRVHIDGQQMECIGLMDSGNQLCDPLTRAPVLIMQLNRWEPLLPPSIVASIRAGRFEFDDGFPWRSRLLLIPFRGFGQTEHGLLIALRVDRAFVEWQGASYQTEHALIGLAPLVFSHEQAYEAIIHPAFVHTYTY